MIPTTWVDCEFKVDLSHVVNSWPAWVTKSDCLKQQKLTNQQTNWPANNEQTNQLTSKASYTGIFQAGLTPRVIKGTSPSVQVLWFHFKTLPAE